MLSQSRSCASADARATNHLCNARYEYWQELGPVSVLLPLSRPLFQLRSPFLLLMLLLLLMRFLYQLLLLWAVCDTTICSVTHRADSNLQSRESVCVVREYMMHYLPYIFCFLLEYAQPWHEEQQRQEDPQSL
jgi:hypothetical protein